MYVYDEYRSPAVEVPPICMHMSLHPLARTFNSLGARPFTMHERSGLVSCPDRTLYAREGLVHEVQILGSDGKFSHYEYHYPIHGRSGKVHCRQKCYDVIFQRSDWTFLILRNRSKNLDLVHQTFPRVELEGVVWARD